MASHLESFNSSMENTMDLRKVRRSLSTMKKSKFQRNSISPENWDTNSEPRTRENQIFFPEMLTELKPINDIKRFRRGRARNAER